MRWTCEWNAVCLGQGWRTQSSWNSTGTWMLDSSIVSCVICVFMGLEGSIENKRGQSGSDMGTMRPAMAANLSQNRLVMQEAYVWVVTKKFLTDWALFIYEGNSSDIHVTALVRVAWRRWWSCSTVGRWCMPSARWRTPTLTCPSLSLSTEQVRVWTMCRREHMPPCQHCGQLSEGGPCDSQCEG